MPPVAERWAESAEQQQTAGMGVVSRSDRKHHVTAKCDAASDAGVQKNQSLDAIAIFLCRQVVDTDPEPFSPWACC